MEHPTPAVAVVVLAMCGFVLGNIFRARKGAKLFIRRIPGVDAIDEAVGRATEMGRPINFVTGLRGIEMPTLQALAIAGYVARKAARLSTRLILPICQPQVYAIAEGVAREAYAAEGRPEAFNEDDVRFVSPSQFAYAAGVIGIMNREKVAANLMFGYFAAESLIMAETGQALGALQVAGTSQQLQVPFFICACDYVVIGEEFYATSAYLTREPTLLGSLVGQDWSKVLLLLSVIAGTVISTYYAAVTSPAELAERGNWFLNLFEGAS